MERSVSRQNTIRNDRNTLVHVTLALKPNDKRNSKSTVHPSDLTPRQSDSIPSSKREFPWWSMKVKISESSRSITEDARVFDSFLHQNAQKHFILQRKTNLFIPSYCPAVHHSYKVMYSAASHKQALDLEPTEAARDRRLVWGIKCCHGQWKLHLISGLFDWVIGAPIVWLSCLFNNLINFRWKGSVWASASDSIHFISVRLWRLWLPA